MTDDASETLTRELLARFLAGDFEAERRLFQRHRAELHRRAQSDRRMRSVAREVSADDVVQEVFWRALSSGFLRRFEDRGQGSLSRALAVILDRTLIDTARRLGAQKRRAWAQRESIEPCERGSDGAPELAATDTTPTELVEHDDLIALCRERLGAREWEVWSAIEVEGLDQPAVAARLALEPPQVAELLFVARKRLIHLAQALSRDGRRP